MRRVLQQHRDSRRSFAVGARAKIGHDDVLQAVVVHIRDPDRLGLCPRGHRHRREERAGTGGILVEDVNGAIVATGVGDGGQDIGRAVAVQVPDRDRRSAVAGRELRRREELPRISRVLEQDDGVAGGTRVCDDQVRLAVAIEVADHQVVRLPAGRHVDRGLVGTRRRSVQEYRDTAGAEVRNHEVLESGAGEVRDRYAGGVVSRRRVVHAGVERTRGAVVAQDDVGEARVVRIALVGGRRNQQIGSAVAIDVRDRYGVRHIKGRQTVVGAVVATGEGAEQNAQTHGREQATPASLDIHSPYLRAQDL